MTRSKIRIPILAATGWIVLSLAGAAIAKDEVEQGEVVAVPDTSVMLFDAKGAAAFGASIGVALVIIGGAKGISRIGGGAVESMARQPEAAGSITTAMIITAAMIEGATLFAVIVCLMALPPK